MDVDLPSLTERQRQVLTFIQERIAEWGYPPTIREIGEHLSIRSTNGVADHLKALKRKGYLTQAGMKSRTLKPSAAATALATVHPIAGSRRQTPVTGQENQSEENALGTVVGRRNQAAEIPILGRVAAGEPILAEEHSEGTVVIDSILVGRGEKSFALKVVGESMVEDGIFDGDFIFVRKRSVADVGDIVVAMIDGEATVKRFYPEDDRIRFQPANSAMEPIYVHRDEFKETEILGVVVGVYRQL